jgi:hypothetical protein
LRAAGVRAEFIPDAVARWRPRPTWTGFFTQYYSYAFGDGADLQLSWKYAAKITVYGTGLALFVGGFYVWSLWLILAVLVLAYMLLAVGRFWAERPHATTALLMPFIEIYNDLADITGYVSGLGSRLTRNAKYLQDHGRGK